MADSENQPANDNQAATPGGPHSPPCKPLPAFRQACRQKGAAWASKSLAAPPLRRSAAPNRPPPSPTNCSLPDALKDRLREELSCPICMEVAVRCVARFLARAAAVGCGRRAVAHSLLAAVPRDAAAASACPPQRCSCLPCSLDPPPHSRRSPATLPCGHTGCRRCLNAALAHGSPTAVKKCPCCRAALPIGMPPLAVNMALKAVVEALLPGARLLGRLWLGRSCPCLSPAAAQPSFSGPASSSRPAPAAFPLDRPPPQRSAGSGAAPRPPTPSTRASSTSGCCSTPAAAPSGERGLGSVSLP